jgi:hypothetical protein
MARTTLVLITGLSLSAGSGACNVRPAVEVNPPTFPHRSAPAEKLERAQATGHFTRILNSRDHQRGVIFASDNGGCHVYLSDDVQRSPGMRPPAAEIRCPPSMLVPEWGHCAGDATMATTDSGDICACRPNGNPPPPAYFVPCPARP